MARLRHCRSRSHFRPQASRSQFDRWKHPTPRSRSSRRRSSLRTPSRNRLRPDRQTFQTQSLNRSKSCRSTLSSRNRSRIDHSRSSIPPRSQLRSDRRSTPRPPLSSLQLRRPTRTMRPHLLHSSRRRPRSPDRWARRYRTRRRSNQRAPRSPTRGASTTNEIPLPDIVPARVEEPSAKTARITRFLNRLSSNGERGAVALDRVRQFCASTRTLAVLALPSRTWSAESSTARATADSRSAARRRRTRRSRCLARENPCRTPPTPDSAS